MPTLIHSEAEIAESLEMLRNELRELRRSLESRIEKLETELAGIKRNAHAHHPPRTEPTAEELAMIAAAVTQFLGKKVKVRSARTISSGTNAWAQQGRAIIQASHNLAR